MLRAVLCTAFSLFLRCGEFTVQNARDFDPSWCLTRGSVEFFPSFADATHAAVKLPGSKTDPFRTGVTLHMAAVPGAVTCPIQALKDYFSAVPASAAAPLFCSSDSATPLTRSVYLSQLKVALAAAGIDPSGFSGHSSRRGAATSAFLAGIPDFEIQQLGRWKSDAFMLYIDVPVSRTLALSAQMHHLAAPLVAVPMPPAFHAPWLA